MKAIVKELGELTLVGKILKDCTPSKSESAFFKIGEEWSKFFPNIKDYFNMENYGNSYGVSFNTRMNGKEMEFDYLIGLKKEDYDEIPNDYEEKVLPASKYAVYTFKGKMDQSKIDEFMNNVYSKWLSEDNLKAKFDYCFEFYDNRYMCDSDTSEFDLYIPVN